MSSQVRPGSTDRALRPGTGILHRAAGVAGILAAGLVLAACSPAAAAHALASHLLSTTPPRAALASTTLPAGTPTAMPASNALSPTSGSLPATSGVPVVPWSSPLVLTTTHGTFSSVTVTDSLGLPVQGSVTARGTRWTSQPQLYPSTRYTLAAHLAGSGGVDTQTITVVTDQASTLLTPLFTPGPGNTVGVGFPIYVTFNHAVTNEAAVSAAMTVTSSIPVTGAWHWFSPTQAHYRPQTFWPAHDTITVDAHLAGVDAGGGAWGHGTYQYAFSTGNAWISHANVTAHTLTVTENGKVVRTIPASFGNTISPTQNGIHIVLEKQPSILMTSCSAQVTCNPTNPNYYSLEVYWDVRISNGGEFVHAAPWNHSLGQANLSVGCVNISTSQADWFYHNSGRRGDVVEVTNSAAATDLQDPGEMDWNMPWSAWLAGSGQATS
ncbi:MAG: L,D-transpeptidase [Actinomycetes bacterium]